MARKIVSKTGMSGTEQAIWYLLIFCTFGFAWPIYRARKHAADRTTVMEVS